MSSIIQPNSDWPYVIIEASPGASLLSIDEAMIISSYKQHGAILFRGFDWDVKAFGDLSVKFCIESVFNESSGRKLLDQERKIQTVNDGSDPFPLHAELSREPWSPDVCFFGCMDPPAAGGETLVCDGVEIVDNMDQDLYDAFESRSLLYAQLATPELCDYWLGSPDPDDLTLQSPPETCPYNFRRIPRGLIIRSFARPALRKPMFSDELAFCNFLLFSRYQHNSRSFPVFENQEQIPDSLVAAVKAISDEISVPVRWQQGDLVMLDNTRFMHGRNTIMEARERKIISYFGYLNFALPSEEEPINAPWRQPGFRPSYLFSR